MKAADGTQIAERWAAEYDEMKTCALRDTAEHYKNRCLTLIEDISRAEERERVLREALEQIEWILVRGVVHCPSCFGSKESGHGVLCKTDEALLPTPEKAALRAKQEAMYAALTAAPEQPDLSVCPDCKSTTRSFRGRRGDEHGEWVCDNEWHAPEQGKEAKS